MKTKLVTSAVLLACSSLALADDALPVKFSGFGTFGAARSNNNEADFRLNPEQSTGTARTNHIDSTLDTKIALQADATLAKGLTATAQLMARKHSDNSSRAEFEWLNLRYQATRDLYLRGGRVQTPMFMLSEFQNVGYSLTALRVPQDVYSQNLLTYLDGIDIGYRHEVGDLLLNAKGLAGSRKLRLDRPNATPPNSTNFDIDVAMATLTGEYHGHTLRAAYSKFNLGAESDNLTRINNSLDALVAASVPNASTLQSNLPTTDVKASFFTFGYSYDKDQYLLQSEYVISRTGGNLYPNKDAWYVLGGYRLGKFTPYASYSQVKMTEKYDLPLIDTSGMAPTNPLYLPAMIVNGTAKGAMVSEAQKTVAAGVRWDVAENVALKLQGDYIRKPSESKGIFINQTKDFEANSRNVSVISASVDFIF